MFNTKTHITVRIFFKKKDSLFTHIQIFDILENFNWTGSIYSFYLFLLNIKKRIYLCEMKSLFDCSSLSLVPNALKFYFRYSKNKWNLYFINSIDLKIISHSKIKRKKLSNKRNSPPFLTFSNYSTLIFWILSNQFNLNSPDLSLTILMLRSNPLLDLIECFISVNQSLLLLQRKIKEAIMKIIGNKIGGVSSIKN